MNRDNMRSAYRILFQKTSERFHSFDLVQEMVVRKERVYHASPSLLLPMTGCCETSSATPYLLSVEVCSGSPSMKRLAMKQSPHIPASTNQISRNPWANTPWTTRLTSSSIVWMSGIIVIATAVPSGSWLISSAGKFFFNLFCKITPPTVIPQTWKQVKTWNNCIHCRLPERRTLWTLGAPSRLHVDRPELEQGRGRNILSWWPRTPGRREVAWEWIHYD